MIDAAMLWLCLIFKVALAELPVQANVAHFPQAELIDGCFYKDARYFSPTSQKTNASTVYQCQQKCVQSSIVKCFFFNFAPATGSCELAPADAAFTAYLGTGSYTGPKVCPTVPGVCTELPTSTYPAADREMSKMAWPMHMVPPKLSCWPKDFIGKRYKSCPTVTVVEDTVSGWPGKCLGLREVLVPYQETCESWCRKQVACSVWQEVEMENPKRTACFQTFWSSGYDCYTRVVNGKEDLSFKPVRAQRIMHGEVRVLKKLSLVHIDGLSRVFDENYFAKHEDAVQACRSTCYSDLGCQWWTFSRARGCYVEDISHNSLPVPLTTASFRVFAQEASDVLDGEYIQHQCKELGYGAISSTQKIPEYSPVTTVTTTVATTAVTSQEIATTAAIALRPQAALPGPAQEAPAEKAPVMAVGAVVVKGIDLNFVPQGQKEKLSRRYAELIAANTRLSRYDVLDLNNKAGRVSLQSWQAGSPILRRLQTTEAAFIGSFKLREADGETYGAALQKLTSPIFYSEVQGETAAMLKHTLAAGDPRVEAVLRKANPSDNLPLNAGKPGVSNANATLWMVVLGTVLVALIIGLLIWLFIGSPAKKVSFTKAAKQGQFRMLGDEDSESTQAKIRGLRLASSRKTGSEEAPSPSREEIEEAEQRAVQMASRLSQEVDEVAPSAMSRYATPYNSGQYQMPAPSYPGMRVVR